MIERRGPQSIIEFPRARFHARHCNHAVAVHGRAPSFLPVRLMDDVSLIFVIISVLVADDANAFLFLCFSVSLSSHLHAAPRFADDHDAIATDRRTTQRELDGEAALVAQRQDESDAARKTLIELSREFKRSASEVRRRILCGIIVCRLSISACANSFAQSRDRGPRRFDGGVVLVDGVDSSSPAYRTRHEWPAARFIEAESPFPD